MVVFLAIVSVLSYLVAVFAFLAVVSNGTDLQFILSGVCAICGTVAAAGAGIVYRLNAINQAIVLARPIDTSRPIGPSPEERMGM